MSIQFTPVRHRDEFEDEVINSSSSEEELSLVYISNGKPQLERWKLGAALIVTIAATIAVAVLLVSPSSSSSSPGSASLSAKQVIAQGLPKIIYGTAWKKDETSIDVYNALDAGFRFIDTACQPKHYNEPGVGLGWTTAPVKREDLYLQTKFSPLKGQDRNNLPYNASAPVEVQVQQSVATSLRNLQTTYLDALILHSPYSKFENTLKVWRAMEEFVDQGTVRRLGISNCNKYETFTKLYEAARIKPVILQNHFKAPEFNAEIFEYARQRDVEYQVFWSLTANKKALEQDTIRSWAAESGVSSPQLYMYAFLIELGMTPLDGTTNHLEEDYELIRALRNSDTPSIFQSSDEIERMAKALAMDMPQL